MLKGGSPVSLSLLSLQAVRAKFTMKVVSTFIDFAREQDAERRSHLSAEACSLFKHIEQNSR
jgi:hypothetical protein